MGGDASVVVSPGASKAKAWKINPDDAEVPRQPVYPSLPGMKRGGGAVEQQYELAGPFIANMDIQPLHGDESGGRSRVLLLELFEGNVGSREIDTGQYQADSCQSNESEYSAE